ncbi:MAG: 6,7-dimethyl-8-ribityllumazine synthase [Flavobacteriales bacterium]|nr:6,7-dimethyl-8-ribityllumazine synthase [Flavobacteriales bacterium]
MATVNLSAYDATTIPHIEHICVGIIVSQWNTEITEGLFSGAKKTLLDLGVEENNIIRYDVPGSYELIYASSALQSAKQVDVIIALGSIIRGETPHFEYISSAVADGLANLNVRAGRKNLAPVIFGVLTDNNIDQSRQRSGGSLGNKGVECAVDAVKMTALRRKIFMNK